MTTRKEENEIKRPRKACKFKLSATLEYKTMKNK